MALGLVRPFRLYPANTATPSHLCQNRFEKGDCPRGCDDDDPMQGLGLVAAKWRSRCRFYVPPDLCLFGECAPRELEENTKQATSSTNTSCVSSLSAELRDLGVGYFLRWRCGLEVGVYSWFNSTWTQHTRTRRVGHMCMYGISVLACVTDRY